MTTNSAPAVEEHQSALDEEDPDEAAAARVRDDEPAADPQTGTGGEHPNERNTMFDISEDQEAAFLRFLMVGGEDEEQTAREEKQRAKDNYRHYVRSYSVRTQLSLERELGLGAQYSPRYELIWFPQIMQGQLVIDVDVIIEDQDEVDPKEVLHNFGDMLDEMTRGYLEGRVRHPGNNRMVPLEDEQGNELRMKAYYLRHSLIRGLSTEERKHFRPFRSQYLRPCPRTLQLEFRKMLEAKWSPGERLLGRTMGVPSHQLRQLPEHKRNADRIFYTALVERERRLEIQNTKSAVPFNLAFGMTPHMVPDFTATEGKAILHPHKRSGVCPAGFVAVMAVPSMAAIENNIEFCQGDMQKLLEDKLCKLQFRKDPKNRVAKYSA